MKYLDMVAHAFFCSSTVEAEARGSVCLRLKYIVSSGQPRLQSETIPSPPKKRWGSTVYGGILVVPVLGKLRQEIFSWMPVWTTY